MDATQTDMNRDVVRLREWMQAHGYTYRGLASELGVPFQRLYHQVRRQQIEDNTRWAFAQRFGWPVANELFDTNGQTSGEAEHAPA